MMVDSSSVKSLEEKLREAACFGDEETVRILLERGVNINSKHDINGWTPLHWASKRGHSSIVKQLLCAGADKSLTTLKGELAAELTSKEDVRHLLGSPTRLGNCEEKSVGSSPIKPNYLSNPVLSYKVNLDNSGFPEDMCSIRPRNYDQEPELVLKVRLAYMDETDFIEIEIPYSELSFKKLLQVCSEELEVDSKQVLKVRKLPDTVLRKDKDVKRLKPFQELELVMKSRPRPLMVDVSHLQSAAQPQQHRIPERKMFGEMPKSGYIVNGKLLY